MAESRITPGEITRLARKLELLDPALNERDRVVLRAVLDLAAAALANSGLGTKAPDPAGPTLSANPKSEIPNPELADSPPLSDGFKDAFQPGTAACFTLDNRTPADDASKRPAVKVRLV